MVTIFFRTVIIYAILMISIRVMGKRQIGELEVSEFIITLMLSEIAVSPISTRSMPLLHAIVPILLLLSIEVMLSYLLMKSNLLKKIFYGTPSILIKRGKLNQEELRKNRVEIEELMAELRQKGFSHFSDVYYAILEENGKLSVFPRASYDYVKPNDLSMTPNENGIAHLCIVDGEIVNESLQVLGWDRRRIFAELKKRKLRLSEVFLMTADDGGKITVVKKELS